MLKRFVKDSAIYGSSTILVRLASAFLLPLYAHILTPVQFGQIDLLLAFAALVNVSVALEVSQGFARCSADTSDDERREYASTSMLFTVGALAAFGLFSFTFAAKVGWIILGRASDPILVRTAVAAMCVQGICYLIQAHLRWSLASRPVAIMAICTSVITLLSTVLCVAVLRRGPLGYFEGMIAGNLAGVAFGWRYARPLYRLTFDASKLREMLAFSLPLVPSSLSVVANMYMSRVAVAKLMSLADAGLLGIGIRVASVVSVLMTGFQASLTPLIYRHYKEPDAPAQIECIGRYLFGCALVLCIGLEQFSPEVLWLLGGSKYVGAADIVPILALSATLSALYIVMPGMDIARKSTLIAGIAVGTAGVNVLLTISLVPVLGVLGAALATLISAAVNLLAYTVLSQRFYRVSHQWWRYALAMTTVVMAFVIRRFLETGLSGLVERACLLVLAVAFLSAIDVIPVPLLYRRIRAGRNLESNVALGLAPVLRGQDDFGTNVFEPLDGAARKTNSSSLTSSEYRSNLL